MTATSKDVIAFKATVKEFASLPDADIATMMDETDVWLDEEMWSARDYPMARRWLTAHYLKMAQFYGIPLSSLFGTTGGGATDLFVSNITFGERSVAFNRRMPTMTRGSRFGPGEASLEETIYGQKFLRLRSRNIPGVLTV